MAEENSEEGSLLIPSIYFTNIGNDIALDIEIDWMLLENLNHLGQLVDIRANVRQEYSDSSMELGLRLGNNQEYWISERPKKNLSFIQANSEGSASFPLTLLDAITFYCYEAFPQDSERTDYSRDFRETAMPCLQIAISYENALNEIVRKDLTIEFRVFRFERNPDGSGYCRFEISAFNRDSSA